MLCINTGTQSDNLIIIDMLNLLTNFLKFKITLTDHIGYELFLKNCDFY